MHFFYMDESGCTGANLKDVNQPIFVLGGISIADQKWNNTQTEFSTVIRNYFDGKVPAGFELHSHELLSPKGEGPFAGHEIDKRLQLVRDILGLLDKLGHDAFFFAIEKNILDQSDCNFDFPFDYKIPYLFSFDYLVTYINWHTKKNLGHTARGLIVLDEKENLHSDIERIVHSRRFEGVAAHRVKWIVEFSYPVDSRKNPMIQISDLVSLCLRRFLEIDKGYKDEWPDVVKTFYAECYKTIDARVRRKNIVERSGKNSRSLNDFLAEIQCKPRTRWKAHYGVL
ncbi:DUF3800 domain-containing protein [Aeromonas taiwanensis]|uniref:DUF3800 domain-containing protein n=1 Tax=Aeromonas taiwanensis TaxID=633417 RepID=UPI000AB30A4D|nr:DUF3800 domain-containing protein [Aeromonas taiwanensis]